MRARGKANHSANQTQKHINKCLNENVKHLLEQMLHTFTQVNVRFVRLYIETPKHFYVVGSVFQKID